MKRFIPLTLLIFLCTGCLGLIPRPVSEAPQSPTPAISTPVPTPSTNPTAGPPSPTPPLEGHIICVDPGHGVTPEIGKGSKGPVSPLSEETKPRFVSGTSGAVMTEEQLNLAVGLKLRDALGALGATVVMTREVSEVTIDNVERCDVANESGADAFVHIHADGSQDTSVHGVSVLIPAGNLLGTPTIVEESARLGQLMVDAVAEKTGAKNRGTIPRTDLSGFNFSHVPTVLIEMGFMSNKDEDALLSTEEYQDKIVAGMVVSLLQWYEIDTEN